MDKQILKIQIQSDLKELEKDINLGVYDRTPEELIKAENRIWEKIEKFIDELQAESERSLKTLRALAGESILQAGINEVESTIGYAVKEGFLDAEEVQEWTLSQKVDYYNRSMAQEPAEEDEPDTASADYPLGGSAEPYDIAREDALIREIEEKEKEAEELIKDK
jgi:SMC interacting uncharacterized protein involved in chromosome segregation